MSTKLECCPFCGSKVATNFIRILGIEYFYCQDEKEKCGAVISFPGDQNDAHRKFNHRIKKKVSNVVPMLRIANKEKKP